MAKQQNTPQSEIKEKMKDIAHDLDKDSLLRKKFAGKTGIHLR